MRTIIIKIGNSRGIRIPGPLLKESGFETMLLSKSALAKDWDDLDAWSRYCYIYSKIGVRYE